MSAEDMHRAAIRAERAAEESCRSADRIEEAVRQLACQFDPGYGGTASRLIELLEDQAMNATLNEARAKSEKLNALIVAMQRDVVNYLKPENECDTDWLVRRVLWHLGSHAQREAQGVQPNREGV